MGDRERYLGSKDRINEAGRKWSRKRVECEICMAEVYRGALSRHQKRKVCKAQERICLSLSDYSRTFSFPKGREKALPS